MVSRIVWRNKEKVAFGEMNNFNVGKSRKVKEIWGNCEIMFYVCHFTSLWIDGLFLIMSSCESMTDLQWALLVRQKIMHCANNTQLSLLKKNHNLTLSQWRLSTQGLSFRIRWWSIVTMHRKWRQTPHKFVSLHCVFIACIIMGKHTSHFGSLYWCQN